MAFTNTREAVAAIFIGYYNRAPAPNGLNYWVNDIDNNGFTVADVARAFAVVDETQAAYPGLTTAGSGDLAADVAFVTAVFDNLFGRAPNNIEGDGSGNFWVQQLQDGADVGQLIIDIISGAQGTDLEIIQNKIEVALAYSDASEAVGNLTRDDLGDTILDDVDETDASVVSANSEIDEFFGDGGPGNPGVPGETFILSTDAARDNLTGTEGNDTFEAFNTELQDGDRMDGGSGTDMLTFFNSEEGPVIAPITTSVEHVIVTNQVNDLNGQADNNVGGYSTNFGDYLAGNIPLDGTIEVDVEIDGGMMSGVTRWEDYDSRADLVIEDARDQDDTDGTFTGDITVAMVSTDPGNVDYAVYFDQPVNTSQNFGTLEIRVLDQEAAFGLPAPSASSTGYLTESSLIEFTFAFDGQPITVELADEEGVTYGADVSFQDLLDQVEAATQQALVDAGVTENLGFSASLGAPVSVGVGNQFTLPLVLTFDVPADTIAASSDDIIVLGRDSGNNGATPATDTFGSLTTVRITEEELIRLNVELDDVGKGSMGGDAMFGAMSTGRQTGDDGTSDSIGIQQFDIEVDRSSQLQTINSTNNALEVVNITNGENDGPNNTTTAADEMIGDLVVRGQANPTEDGFIFDGAVTDGPMPGAVPQHNSFGFSDVRVINAAAMVGAVDLTAELTAETTEKYLDIQDTQVNGEADDVLFDYQLGTNDDEFLLNMDQSSFELAGTGSREDFNLNIDGNDGDDAITTNIGDATKLLDAQGQDFYVFEQDNDERWYENTVANNSSDLSVDGGAGNDIIWTFGWGDFDISDGSGADVVYTDNSGVELIGDSSDDALSIALDRVIGEHDQIDYFHGAVWAFNAEFDTTLGGSEFAITGATNDDLVIGTVATATTELTSGSLTVLVSFNSAGGTAGTEYVVSTEIPFTALTKVPGSTSVTVSDQELNQAVKRAINDDRVLSDVLEAVDGPGNSLAVYSKIDGVFVADDLEVSLGNVTLNGSTPVAATTTDFLASYLNTTGANTPGTVATTFTGKLFEAAGGASEAETDNTIFVAGDSTSDVFVLSTSDTASAQPGVSGALLAATDLNGASNEVLMFDANFGVDTVFNFDAAVDDATTTGIDESDNGVDGAEDVLDFSMITGGTNTLEATFGVVADNDVVIRTVATVDDTGGADAGVSVQADEAVAYFLANGGTDDTTAAGVSDHILITYDSTGDNGGTVWHITDGAGTGDVAAANVGTINLIGVEWTAITDDNIA